MKQTIKFSRNLFTLSFLFIAFAFISCEQESLSDESFNIENTTFSIVNDCSECLNPEGPYVISSDSEVLVWGNGNHTKTVSYTVYNTPSNFVVEVFYERNNGNASDLIRVTALNEIQEQMSVQSGSTAVFEFALANNWETCDNVAFEIHQEGSGSPIELNGNYDLFSFCAGCTEEFNYVANEDGSYTFTYTSEENLENAEVKFTSPHITGFVALDGKEYTTNPGQGNGSNTVLTWTGDITMCEAISFTLLFDADCSQNNSGFANVFTDFKVNDVSKKGEAENIRVICE